jgi:hypothetical protein
LGDIASLIETCKLSGVDPHAYLADTLTRMVDGGLNSKRASALGLRQSPAAQARGLKTALTFERNVRVSWTRARLSPASGAPHKTAPARIGIASFALQDFD